MKNEILQILSEECAEVIVATSKIIRFGENEKNLERLKCELGDLQCLINLAKEKFEITEKDMENLIDLKKEKLTLFSNIFN